MKKGLYAGSGPLYNSERVYLQRGYKIWKIMKRKEAPFRSGIGFVLRRGRAVGLGNLWRFPYLVAQYGGRNFILVYIIAALTFGFCINDHRNCHRKKDKEKSDSGVQGNT